MEFFSVLVDPNMVHYSQVAADQLVPAPNSFHCLSCLGNIRKWKNIKEAQLKCVKLKSPDGDNGMASLTKLSCVSFEEGDVYCPWKYFVIEPVP